MVPAASVLALARALACYLDEGRLLISSQVIGRAVHFAEFAARVNIDLASSCHKRVVRLWRFNVTRLTASQLLLPVPAKFLRVTATGTSSANGT